MGLRDVIVARDKLWWSTKKRSQKKREAKAEAKSRGLDKSRTGDVAGHSAKIIAEQQQKLSDGSGRSTNNTNNSNGTTSHGSRIPSNADHTPSVCLRTSTPLHCCSWWQRKLEDKMMSRSFAQSLNVPVPDLLWSGKQPDLVPFSALLQRRRPYVLKASMGSCAGFVFLMWQGHDMLHRRDMTEYELVRKMHKAQREFPNSTIMVERAMRHAGDTTVKAPVVYRFFMRGGETVAICVDAPSSAKWCDAKWGSLPFYMRTDEHKWAHKPLRIPSVPHQALLSEYARRLGKAYQVWVRIDFFVTDRGPIFNEFSMTPWMGNNFTTEGNEYLAKHWAT